MTTMTTIVQDALSTMGVTEIGETPDDEDFSYALGVANDMFHGWRSKGVDIGHATLTKGEHVNLLQEHEEGAKLLLATHPRMITRFGSFETYGDLVGEAKQAWRSIYAAYAAPGPAPINDGLAQMPSQRGQSSLL